MTRLAVIGAGAWGTALAMVARRARSDVALWARDPAVAAAINERRKNPVYLPASRSTAAIRATPDLAEAIAAAEAALIAVPAHFLREVLTALAPRLPAEMPLLLCAKGIETGSLKSMSNWSAAAQVNPLAVLSGPSFAGEVARDRPTAVTVASRDSRSLAPPLTPRPMPSGPVVGRRYRCRDRRRGRERAGDRLRRARRAASRAATMRAPR